MQEKKSYIPFWLLDIVSFISGIVTIGGAVVGAFEVRKIVANLPNEKYEVNLNSWLICLTISLVFLLVVVFLQMRKYGQLLQKARKVITKNYYNFLHDFRNQYYEMLKEHKTNSGTTKEHKVELLTQDTKKYMTKGLDYLCDMVSSASREEISACVKVIENTGGDGKSIDIEQARIQTFCRSRNTEGERTSRDTFNEGGMSAKIVDNTDFYDILKGDSSSCFYQRDLCAYAKKLEAAGKEYKNSTGQYWKYYKGTVVAPIRIAKKRLYYDESDSGFDVIGFLCIDTLSTNVFREKDKAFYTKIVKSFAADMYVILNKYNYYLAKIMEEK